MHLFLIDPHPGLRGTVDTLVRFCLHRRVKWLVLCALLAMQCSCTTLVNRRDLYRPNEGPVPTRAKTPPTPEPEPQFR